MLVLTTLGAPRAGPRLRRGRAQPVAERSRRHPAAADPGDADPPAAVRRRGGGRRLAERGLRRPRPLEQPRPRGRRAAEPRCSTPTGRRPATPTSADVDPGRAVAVRFGFGTGDEVADGRWHAANELADPERQKLVRRDYEALRPQERVAAVLGGRETVGAYEDLIVRRPRRPRRRPAGAAALGLHAALQALAASGADVGAAAAAAAAANRAVLERRRSRPPALEAALREAEAAIRRRGRLTDTLAGPRRDRGCRHIGELARRWRGAGEAAGGAAQPSAARTALSSSATSPSSLTAASRS